MYENNRKSNDLLFLRTKRSIHIYLYHLMRVYVNRFDLAAVLCVCRRPHHQKGRKKATHNIYIYIILCAVRCLLYSDISRPHHGTSTPNILAVLVAADENKNFLFLFFFGKSISRVANGPFRRGAPRITIQRILIFCRKFGTDLSQTRVIRI